MTDVGVTITSTQGLGSVVQVIPAQGDSGLSQAVVQPFVQSGEMDALPPEYFGLPLPGQATTVAAYVQTVIETSMPSSPMPSPLPDTAPASSAADTTFSAPTSGNEPPTDSQPQPVPAAFTTAVNAYQTAQDRHIKT
jgi:hypothetical protein